LRHVPKLAKRKHVAVRPAIVEVRVLLSAWVSMNQSAETPVGTLPHNLHHAVGVTKGA
jgi:hypothetical protein